MTDNKTTVLSQITVLDRQLAKARTYEEHMAVAKQADVIAQAAKRLGVHKSTVNQAVYVLIQAKRAIGKMLGEAPRRGPKGKDDCFTSETILPKVEVSRCRAGAALPDDVIQRYRQWSDGSETTDHISWRDVLTLGRLGDKAEPVIKLLEEGAKSIGEANRMLVRDTIVKGTVKVPKGEYRTIVIDPPWPIQKIEREVAPRQAGLDYQTMTLDEIAAIDLPKAEAAHCYLWTTQRFLPCSFAILEDWGFDYLVTLVWHKAGGFQPVNLPQYNCEFVLLGRRGKLGFLDTKDFPCCFEAGRTGHSKKPDAFYDLVARVSPDPRIDMYGRKPRPGFRVWGLEA